MGRDHALSLRYCRPAGQAVLVLGLVALAASVLAPNAAGAALDDAPPDAVTESAVSEPQCVLEDVDDKCETWTAVYDDSDLYDNSLSTYAVEPTASDTVRQLASSPTGERVFTFGQSCRQSNPSLCWWAVVAHRADSGDELWAAREPAFGPQAVMLEDIAVSSDGNRVYATGLYASFNRAGDWDPLVNTEVVTIAWDATNGHKLWERVYSGEPSGHRAGDRHDLHSGDGGVAVVADPDGDRVYVTGYSGDRESFYSVLVIAYDGVTGAQQWVTRDDTSTANRPHIDDKAIPQLAQVSPDGTTLYLAAASGSEHRLAAYRVRDSQDPTGEGTLLWDQDNLAGRPQSLDIAPDGSRIYLREAPNRIAAYDVATGAQAWPSRPTYNDGLGDSFDTPRDLAVSPGGDVVVVTGRIPQSTEDARIASGYGTIVYDAATGAPVWDEVKRFDGGTGSAVGVSPDGSTVYVTGTGTGLAAGGTTGGVTGTQATIAYDIETGDQLWIAMYSRPLEIEHGDLLDVGPDGTVFTAGTLPREGSAYYPSKNRSDWGVQAYEP